MVRTRNGVVLYNIESEGCVDIYFLTGLRMVMTLALIPGNTLDLLSPACFQLIAISYLINLLKPFVTTQWFLGTDKHYPERIRHQQGSIT